MTGGGALDSSVTLEEVFTVVGAKRVPLAPELAGYLVLEIAEHADPSGGDVDPRSVFIGEEGTVALVKPRREAANGEAEVSIRAMLSKLLEASGSLTPALAAAGKRKSGAGLMGLAEELEIALIPVNRAAGRRALARLAREVRRVTLGVGRNALPPSADGPPSLRRASTPSQPDGPRSSGLGFSREEDPTTARGRIPDSILKKATPASWAELPTTEFEPSSRAGSPSQADVDALIDRFAVSDPGEEKYARDLKAMVGLEPTPAPVDTVSPPSSPPERHGGQETAEVDALLVGAAEPAPLSPVASTQRSPAPFAAPFHPRDDLERQLPTQPSQLHRARASFASAPRMSPRSRRGPLVLAACATAALGAVVVWQFRPAATRPAVDAEPSAASAQPPRPAVAACRGTLVVSDVPAHAEVLLQEGQAPVDVERMPVGTRLEFVATAEGFAPKRVVVPKGATWDTGSDGKPRLELAVQLDKTAARGAALDAWPAGEPGSEVGGQGPPGTVRVVSTPRGAEVWMLAGIGPEARIEQLRCDRSFDVLVAGPTTFRKRLRVNANDFAAQDGPSAEAIAAPGLGAAAREMGPVRIAKVSVSR